MDYFVYRDNRLFAEDVAIEDIVRAHGSPCYVYSRATFERHWTAFDEALSAHQHLVCFAVKANSNLGVLNVLAKLGSGFDIVSGGELERVLAAGGDASKIVFSGVGKTAAEMRRALEVGIRAHSAKRYVNPTVGMTGNGASLGDSQSSQCTASTRPSRVSMFFA